MKYHLKKKDDALTWVDGNCGVLLIFKNPDVWSCKEEN